MVSNSRINVKFGGDRRVDPSNKLLNLQSQDPRSYNVQFDILIQNHRINIIEGRNQN